GAGDDQRGWAPRAGRRGRGGLRHRRGEPVDEQCAPGAATAGPAHAGHHAFFQAGWPVEDGLAASVADQQHGVDGQQPHVDDQLGCVDDQHLELDVEGLCSGGGRPGRANRGAKRGPGDELAGQLAGFFGSGRWGGRQLGSGGLGRFVVGAAGLGRGQPGSHPGGAGAAADQPDQRRGKRARADAGRAAGGADGRQGRWWAQWCAACSAATLCDAAFSGGRLGEGAQTVVI
ncbi:hypothetical protein TMLG_04161, partial [Mycobacterium tuberculosis SUMu012]